MLLTLKQTDDSTFVGVYNGFELSCDTPDGPEAGYIRSGEVRWGTVIDGTTVAFDFSGFVNHQEGSETSTGLEGTAEWEIGTWVAERLPTRD